MLLVAITASSVLGAVTSPPGETPGQSFVATVLQGSSVPPGAIATNRVLSSSLGRPFETPATGPLTDLHQRYLVDEGSGAVERYVYDHLPVAHGGVDGRFRRVGDGTRPCRLAPDPGPNENMAQLVYTLWPLGSRTELRVDAQVVWLPNRPSEEVAASHGDVDLTGFAAVSPMEGSSGPVTTRLRGAQAGAILAVLKALPLGPQGLCTEDEVL